MRRVHKLTFSAILVAVAFVAGIFIFMNRPKAPVVSVDRGANAPRSTDYSSSRIDSVKKESIGNPGQSSRKDGEAFGNKAPASKVDASILNSEKSLVAEFEGNQGVDVKTSASLMIGDNFHDFMERLSLESSGVPLARDITDLYTRAAAEANSNVDNEVNINVVCGMVVCGISATAPTKDVFEAWFKLFAESQTARPHAAGRYDKILDNGSVEYRIIFSNDPQRKMSIGNSR